MPWAAQRRAVRGCRTGQRIRKARRSINDLLASIDGRERKAS